MKFAVNWPFVKENIQIDFQGGGPGSQLEFPIRTILANFLSLSCPNTSFQKFESGPFGSGVEAQNRFSRWRPKRPSWITNQNDFSYL